MTILEFKENKKFVFPRGLSFGQEILLEDGEIFTVGSISVSEKNMIPIFSKNIEGLYIDIDLFLKLAIPV